MKENYAKAMKIELTYEGGRDDDPVDPGGRTNQGIIQREYSAWRKSKGRPVRDVFLMEPEERDEIYRINYANKVQFDELPPGIDLLLLAGAINSGPVQSIKWVQRALGLTANGVLGVVTMQRIASADQDALIDGIISRREAFLRALKTWPHFGKGWTARCEGERRAAHAWVLQQDGPTHMFVQNGNKKAKIVDAKALPSTAPADATASGGAVSTALSTAQNVFNPLQGSSHIVDHIILGLTIAGSLAIAGGLAYGVYARRSRTALTDALDLAPATLAPADNDDVPPEVLKQYVDPKAQGSETGNIAPGAVTQSGRVAGDTEVKKSEAA